MYRLLTALRRGFKEKIGWKRLGIAASLTIIVLAVFILLRTLKVAGASGSSWNRTAASRTRSSRSRRASNS